MNKLRRDVRLAMAGACAGLFSVSVFLLGHRVLAFYDYLASRKADRYVGVEDLWWVPVVVWHVVLSGVASLLMHRYLASGRTSTFLRWQAVGAVVLIGWGLSLFTAIGMECLVRGTTQPIEQLWSMGKLMPVAQFVAAVFAANVLYGSAIHAASMEDLRTQSEVNGSEA